MNILHILVILGLLQSTRIGDLTEHGRNKAFIDAAGSCGEPHRTLPDTRAWALIDSSGNGYSAWTQMHECISYNALNDAVQFVNRGYSPTGILYTHQAPFDFSFHVDDLAYELSRTYKSSFGNARYPTSVASDDGTPNGPHISFSSLVLDPVSFGHMLSVYCSGGWYSSYWHPIVDLGPGDLNTHKCIGKQLPDGNIIFLGVTDTDLIIYRTYAPTLDSLLAEGTIASAVSYWGFDCNGGIAYVFYYDGSLDIYYRTTTDGINWSIQQSYNMVWPEPYTNNLIFWTQMAVDGNGHPWLIFDNLDNDDYGSGCYPYLGKIYVSRGSGLNCIEMSTGLDRNFYPTIAADGNYIVVLWHSPATSDIDSLCWWDLYYTWSGDGGSSWTGPINLTGAFNDRLGLAQLSKRLGSNGLPIFFFGVDMVVSHDPIWHVWRDNEGLDPIAWYWGTEVLSRIEEQPDETPSQLILTIFNPATTCASVSYAMPYAGIVAFKVYDRTGRLVNTINDGYRDAGVYTTYISTQDLASGTYFVTLDTPAGSTSGTMVVVQ